MKLSVITLTYNKLDYTKKYIESLYKYTKDFELIIVDNGSTDGTVEYIKTLENVKLIENKENLGFSKGNNQGIEIAQGEYIGFLNNDILLSPNWFEECEKVFQKENAGFVSPLQILPGDNINEKNYLKIFNTYKHNSDYVKTFDSCVFSCVITKRDVLNKIGCFDENYTPAFFEDNDLKYRAICENYHIFRANKACFFHYESITSRILNQRFIENQNYYYSKFQFSEYLSISAQEKNELIRIVNDFQKFPLKQVYSFYKKLGKCKYKIKRLVSK